MIIKSLFRIFFIVLAAFSFLINMADAQNTIFSKKDFYAAMASSDTALLNTQLALLKKADIKEKPAYEGALLMKIAGLIKGANKKVKAFKDGQKKLESAISRNSENAEFRFLRLMIQENAPGILHYKNDLDKDSTYIRQSFKKLPAEVQQAISNYSKKSTVLRPDDF